MVSSETVLDAPMDNTHISTSDKGKSTQNSKKPRSKGKNKKPAAYNSMETYVFSIAPKK